MIPSLRSVQFCGMVGLIVLLSTGCSHMSHTERGMGIGSALGAGAGLAIGAATNNPKTGALAGGLVGAGLGGIIGSEADEKERQEAMIQQAALEAEMEAANAPLGLTDVIQLAQQGVGEQVILNYIRTTNSRFQLSPADIAHLHNSGVPESVINEMMNSSRRGMEGPRPRTVVVREPQTIIYERPYFGPRPVYVMPPAPPPFGMGFHYVKVR